MGIKIHRNLRRCRPSSLGQKAKEGPVERHPATIPAMFGQGDGMASATIPSILVDVKDSLRRGDYLRAQTVLTVARALVPHDHRISDLLAEVDESIQSSRHRLARASEFFDAVARMPAAHVAFTGKPGSLLDGKLKYDAWGFLNESLPTMPKPSNERRIFIVGDSTMCGGESIQATVPGLMQRDFIGRGSEQTKVYNFSVVSTRATQMLSLIMHQLLELEPDVILICVGAAELYVPLTYDPRPAHPFNFYVVEELYSQFFDSSCDGHGASTDFESVMQGVADRHARLREQVKYGSEEWAVSHVEAFRTFLTKLDRLTNAWQVPTRVVLQPLVSSKLLRTRDEENFCSPQTLSFFMHQYERLKDVLGASGVLSPWGENLAVHDASNVFDDAGQQIFEDFVHYNSTGRALVSARLMKVLDAAP